MSNSSVFGYLMMGAVYLTVPVTAYLWLRKFGSARFYPIIVGALTYFLSTRMCDLTIWIVFSSLPMSAKVAVSTELVAFFEEPGRWLAMKYPITDIKNSRSAFCYGIGHAGLECIIRGIQAFSIAAGRSEAFTGHEWFILDYVHIVTNFGVHIALSLLIFKKMNEPRPIKRLGLAILLHYILNAVSVVVSLAGSQFFTVFAGIFTDVCIILLIAKIIDGMAVMNEVKYHTDDI